MQSIADIAGVSTTTVSLALRDHASISDATKKRIVEIQHSVGYQFNGRRSKARQPYRPNLEQIVYHTVGIDMREDNYAPFLAGIMTECRLRGIKLELDNVPTSHVSGIGSVNPGSIPKRGIIISGRVTDQIVGEVDQSGFPYVLLGNYFLSKPVHEVGIDLFEIAERMMKKLFSEGMKQAVFFVEIQDRPFERAFLSRLRGVLSDLGVPVEKTTVVEAGLDFQNMDQAAATVKKKLQSGTRIVTLEQHCAEMLTKALHANPHPDMKEHLVSSFVTSRPRFPNPGYRAFDGGAELCGRLAVARLTELQRSPDLPLNTSCVYSPGWVS